MTGFKFMKLAWDYFGSELAGRHSQYERFYAGPQFVHTFYNFNNCPWDDRKRQIDELMLGMQIPPPLSIPKFASEGSQTLASFRIGALLWSR